MISFSSSKSIAPTVSADNYVLQVYRNGVKSEFLTNFMDDAEWGALRQEIIDCRNVSMSYLYLIQD